MRHFFGAVLSEVLSEVPFAVLFAVIDGVRWRSTRVRSEALVRLGWQPKDDVLPKKDANEPDQLQEDKGYDTPIDRTC